MKKDGNKKVRRKSSATASQSSRVPTTAEKSLRSTGFPPGITVDELFHYRKKKPPADAKVQDNLRAEEGSFQQIKSEYRRRFLGDAAVDRKDHEGYRFKAGRPEDSLKVEGSLELNPEYYESFIVHPIERAILCRPKNLISGADMDVVDEEEKTDDEQDDSEQPPGAQPGGGRHYLFKRPTNLKLEGDLYTETENAEKFIHYLLSARPDLARTPTTLKLEGDMETKTETRAKYVPFEYQSRPPLVKKSTNLHLEGVLDITTETREKFLPLQVHQRAPLTKRGTNLHLEGDLKLQPEYRDVFVEHKEAPRRHPKFPVNNLKTEGYDGGDLGEKSEKFVDHQIHPVIPFLREAADVGKKLTLGDDCSVRRAEYREKFVEHPRSDRCFHHKPKENLKPEGDMETVTENQTQFAGKPGAKTEMRRAANNLLLEGNLDMNPEYRNAYVNFYRDAYGKFGVKKDEKDEPEKRRRRTVSHPAPNLRHEGVMDTNPEYKSSFVDFPRQRPSVKKPAGHLHSEGNLSHVTEKRAQYVQHPKAPKAHPLKRQTELKLEGPFECQPEYRRAYIDYLTREKIELLRPADNLATPSTSRVFDVPQVHPPVILEETATPTAGDGSATLPEAKGDLPAAPVLLPPPAPPAVDTLPIAKSRHSSLSPVPRAPGKKLSKDNLSKMENCLFGPKVPNPGGRTRSRNPTPATEAGKRLGEAERHRLARARRRYGSPVIVENLAYTPRTSPVQAILQASTRRRWQLEDDSREKQSFVVLGSLREAEGGCNESSGHGGCRHSDRKHVGYSDLYKEQKWMPSWYAPSSK